MKNRNYHNGTRVDLLRALQTAAQNPSLLEMFLNEFWTPSEWDDMIKRWRVIVILHYGATQRETALHTKASLEKINRLAKLLHRPNSSLKKILKHR